MFNLQAHPKSPTRTTNKKINFFIEGDDLCNASENEVVPKKQGGLEHI